MDGVQGKIGLPCLSWGASGKSRANSFPYLGNNNIVLSNLLIELTNMKVGFGWKLTNWAKIQSGGFSVENSPFVQGFAGWCLEVGEDMPGEREVTWGDRPDNIVYLHIKHHQTSNNKYQTSWADHYENKHLNQLSKATLKFCGHCGGSAKVLGSGSSRFVQKKY